MSPPGNANGGHPRPGPAIAELILNQEIDSRRQAAAVSESISRTQVSAALGTVDLGRDQRRERRTTGVKCACGSWHLFRGLGNRTAACGRRYRLTDTGTAVAA